MGDTRRVLHVIPHSSGTPWLEDLLPRLQLLNWEPVVATITPEGPIHSALRRAGVSAIALNCTSRRQYLSAILRITPSVHAVSLVHAHWFDSAVVAEIAAQFACRRVILTRHEQPKFLELAAISPLKRRVFSLLDSLTLRRASAVIAPSHGVADELRRLGVTDRRVQRIALGLDLDRVTRVDRDRAGLVRASLAPNASLLAITVGRLVWEKQIDVLLRAWKTVTTRLPHAHLLIAGDGPQRTSLEVLARDLHIGSAVSFLGRRHDVLELMLAADVVVQPSATESTGLVLIEALALQRPLISTSVGIVEEYLRDEAGCLVAPQGDSEALANAILSVATAPEKAVELARRGAIAVTRYSSVEMTAKRYVELYERVMVDA